MKDFGIKLKLFYDIEEFISSLDEFSDNTNYGYSVEENSGEILVNFEILPYMPLRFSILDDICLNINTCYFGLGFHILVLEFIRELVEFLGCEYDLVDETGFSNNRKIDELSNVFDNWIEERAKIIVESKSLENNYALFFEDKGIVPKYEEGYILAYTGLVSLTEFKELISEGLKALKHRIFIFPELTDEVFSSEGYLLYHIWNNLKDLTMVDDFDERVSLTMFIFENLVNNGVKIHLPQKFARDIYKYLGVEGFSASNFVYRKVKYEVGYHLFDWILTKFDYKFIIPSGFEINLNKNTYNSEDNSIFINDYLSNEDLDFNSKVIDSFEKENYKIFVFETENKGKPFIRSSLNEDYISLDRHKLVESTSAKLTLDKKIFDIVVYGQDSYEYINKVLGLV